VTSAPPTLFDLLAQEEEPATVRAPRRARGPVTHTVSGPGLDYPCQSEGGALNVATRAAERSSSPCSFYVRDAGGELVARVDATGSGSFTLPLP
jgi:hypothetical protein